MRKAILASVFALSVVPAVQAQSTTTGKAADAAGSQTIPAKPAVCKDHGRGSNGRPTGGTPIITGNMDVRVDSVGQVITSYCP